MKIMVFSLSLENHVCCAYVLIQSNVLARLLQFTMTSVTGLESIILRKLIHMGLCLIYFCCRSKQHDSIESLSLAKHLSTLESCVCVCIPILVTTFPEWLSEPLPHTPGAVRPSSLCL